MTQKLVDGILVDLTPEEEAEYQQRLNTLRVDPAEWKHGPTIAEALQEPINVKS
jgi:hypothetical protein